MSAEKILNNNKLEEAEEGFYTLASTATRHLGVEFSPLIKGKGKGGKKKVIQEQGSLFPEYTFTKSVRDEFSSIGDQPFTLQQIVYGANDVWMPLLIRRKQLRLIRKESQGEALKLENRYTPVLAETELYGIRVNSDKWMLNYEKYQDLEDKAKEGLKEIQDIN